MEMFESLRIRLIEEVKFDLIGHS